MGQLNYQFFDEFKRLDKLCREIYGDDCKRGVTLYLKDMEDRSYEGSRLVDGWNGDYTRLRQLRDFRNRLAHDVNIDEECRQSDIDFITLFRQRILNGTDPLTLLRKEQEKARPSRQAPAETPRKAYIRPPLFYDDRDEERSDGVKFLLTVLATVAVLAVVYIISQILK